MNSIIYLAGPYTDPDPAVRIKRFEALNKVAAKLIASGNIVYSPISHCHPIDLIFGQESTTMPTEFWQAYDEAFMRFCSQCYVLKVPGWEKSPGVQREIAFFNSRSIPVQYLDPKDYGIEA